jgi:hypothetical protein
MCRRRRFTGTSAQRVIGGDRFSPPFPRGDTLVVWHLDRFDRSQSLSRRSSGSARWPGYGPRENEVESVVGRGPYLKRAYPRSRCTRHGAYERPGCPFAQISGRFGISKATLSGPVRLARIRYKLFWRDSLASTPVSRPVQRSRACGAHSIQASRRGSSDPGATSLLVWSGENDAERPGGHS